jgi:hypothetical protein
MATGNSTLHTWRLPTETNSVMGGSTPQPESRNLSDTMTILCGQELRHWRHGREHLH